MSNGLVTPFAIAEVPFMTEDGAKQVRSDTSGDLSA